MINLKRPFNIIKECDIAYILCDSLHAWVINAIAAYSYGFPSIKLHDCASGLKLNDDTDLKLQSVGRRLMYV